MTTLDRTRTLEELIEGVLACPNCHSSLDVHAGTVSCSSAVCTFEGRVADDVVLMERSPEESFFDDKHELMQRGNTGRGIRCLCYDQQQEYLRANLRPGAIVLDAGCGPALPYQRSADYFLIGLDPSYKSIRANTDVDLRVYGSATSLPVPDNSVDAILCLYSVHHMVGQSVETNHEIVRSVFHEFGRALKQSGGDLFIFEVNPWRPFWVLEQLVWNQARRVLNSTLDMYFWSESSLSDLGRSTFPNARFRQVPFPSPILSTFPPVFSMPWLQWPRFLYPFDATLFHWRV
jgi:ubiquinone/menaquinone biosynthesis C-methylase UbiE